MKGAGKHILWIDNDSRHIYPFALALRDEGYNVAVVPTVSEGEARLARGAVSLVILDVMIPVTSAEEKGEYSPDKTDETHETGLAFYRKNEKYLTEHEVPVIVMTVRPDQGIADAFVHAGLPADRFVRKFEVREVDAFLAKIHNILK
jgi:CheY-like chemotaxis protein